MTKVFFITGTDTNIGKTTVSIKLMQDLASTGHSVLGLKPVASGCVYQDGVLINTDALQLQQTSNINTQYAEINPYRFELPVSPHIVNTDNITAQTIALSCKKTIDKYKPDYCLIEGAGGWLCPLNNTEDFSAIATQLKNLDLDLSIILVVGIQLGCLNHAVLTYNSIKQSGLPLHGWIANNLEPSSDISIENISYLKIKLDTKLLLEIPFLEEFSA